MYTRSNLREDLEFYNRQLSKTGRTGIHFQAQGRNGYTAIDIYDSENGGCLSNLCCGTPRECREAILSMIVAEL